MHPYTKSRLLIAVWLMTGFIPCSAFAGQSLVVNGSNNINITDPLVSQNQSWRIEFQLHNFQPPAGTVNLFAFNGLGAFGIFSSDGRLGLYTRDPDQQQQPCLLSTTGITNALVRMQKNASSMLLSCEIWNYDGTAYGSDFDNLTALTPGNSTGATIGSGVNGSLGFLRVFTTLAPLGSKPPTTADSGDWTELKFDGNLNDSSGHGHNASGSAAYMATPNQVVIAVAKTHNAPVWNNWASLRAGYPAQLDATQSYSLADSSSAVSAFWQETSGPTTLRWANRNSTLPTVSGLIFGTYNFALQVTDINGSTSSATLQTGAVATDDNGVVINQDPRVDQIFGPMIAFGRNPWGYEDYWAYHALTLRAADYVSQGWAPVPQWENVGAGTVSYYWNGVGTNFGGNRTLGTTLASAISATSTSLTIKSASGLDLTQFPTRILLNSGGAPEEIRICSATGNVLTVCYDGRGQNAQAWAAGVTVGQAKVIGTGTSFLTNPVAAVCPLGAPAPPGPASYTAGRISLTPGSATMTGAGATWTGAFIGSFVLIPATHGGTPFSFIAIINTVNGPGSITLNRPFPSDADSGPSLSYAIMSATRTIDLRYPHAIDPSGNGESLFGTTGCESETAVYLNPLSNGNSFASGHDTALDGQHVTNQQYSVTDTTGWITETSTGGINFYGESLASRSFYYRSGLTAALNAANVIDDYWIKSPWGNADGNGYPPLFLGGGGVAAFASAILTGRVSWSDLRGYSAYGETEVTRFYNNGNTNCEYDDTRDSGYTYAWLIMGALFDPDTTGFRARWRNDLAHMQLVDTACKRANSSWSNGFLWNNNTGPITLTSASVAGTGTNIPSSACGGVSSGAGTVSNGSATINSSFGNFPSTGATVLVLTGTLSGAPFTASYYYTGSGTTATLAALWPGDTGSVTWMSSNVPGNDVNALTTFATSNSDYTDLANNYACIWNSSSSITLDHPWRGANGSNYYLYEANLAGFGQQPYMLGIKTYGMNLLRGTSDPALASNATTYAGFASQAVQWIQSTGYDPVTQGLFYGRGYPFCEPATTPPAGSSLEARTPGCNFGLSPDAIVGARELNAEIANATSVAYQLQPTPFNKAWGDLVYGSLWGFAPYTTGGVYTDKLSPVSNLGLSTMGDPYIHGGKWYGFFTGMGMAHTWPATRLGGVAPARTRTVSISLSAAASTTANIVVTAPSGAVTNFPCTSASACPVTVDDRQGSHWFTVQYLSESGKVVRQSDPDLLPVTGQ